MKQMVGGAIAIVLGILGFSFFFSDFLNDFWHIDNDDLMEFEVVRVAQYHPSILLRWDESTNDVEYLNNCHIFLILS